jgi:hypothetical protein
MHRHVVTVDNDRILAWVVGVDNASTTLRVVSPPQPKVITDNKARIDFEHRICLDTLRDWSPNSHRNIGKHSRIAGVTGVFGLVTPNQKGFCLLLTSFEEEACDAHAVHVSNLNGWLASACNQRGDAQAQDHLVVLIDSERVLEVIDSG